MAGKFPQGPPLSPILYMFYNADLLNIPTRLYGSKAHSSGFIDDVAYGIQGPTAEGNARALQTALEKAEEWRTKHGAKFETSKYILVHFTRNTRISADAAVVINGYSISPANEARYLGVIFDKRLQYTQHRQQIVKKGTAAAMGLARIAKSTWGMHYQHVKQLYTAVVASRMDYAAIIWHRPALYGKSCATTKTAKMDSVQRIAMKAILGCFRTTPNYAMERETGLLPTHLRLQSKILRAYTRMQTLPTNHPVPVDRQNGYLPIVRREKNIKYTLKTCFSSVPIVFPLRNALYRLQCAFLRSRHVCFRL